MTSGGHHPMEKGIVAAMDENRAIGAGGRLPWHVPTDLRRFRALTQGFPVIMGRRTWESLGRPLPGRDNIVLSRSQANFPGARRAASLSEAYGMASEAGARRCFVIGGETVYREALSRGDTDRVHLTLIHTQVPGADAFFPPLDSTRWEQECPAETAVDEASGLSLTFFTYRNSCHRV